MQVDHEKGRAVLEQRTLKPQAHQVEHQGPWGLTTVFTSLAAGARAQEAGQAQGGPPTGHAT